VTGELGAVVEGDGSTQPFGQRREQPGETPRDRLGGFAGRSCGEQDARLTLMNSQHRLAVF
jgi:hypothetical protein